MPGTLDIFRSTGPTFLHILNMYTCVHTCINFKWMIPLSFTNSNIHKTEKGKKEESLKTAQKRIIDPREINEQGCSYMVYLYSKASMLVLQHKQQIPFLTLSHLDSSFSRPTLNAAAISDQLNMKLSSEKGEKLWV